MHILEDVAQNLILNNRSTESKSLEIAALEPSFSLISHPDSL